MPGMPVGSPGMEVPGSPSEEYAVILFGPQRRTFTIQRRVAAIVGLLAVAAVAAGAYRESRQVPSHGFGADWDCINHPMADVCIKRSKPL